MNEYEVLCERLKARFENRGVNNPDVQSRVSLMKEKEKVDRRIRAQREAKKKSAPKKIEPGFTSAKRRLSGSEYRRHVYDSFDAEEHFFVPDNGRFGLAYEKARVIRRRAASFDRRAYEVRHPGAVKIVKKPKVEVKASRRSFKEVMGERIASMIPTRPESAREAGEKIVKRSPIPKGAVAAILLCTLLLLAVLYTYSSYTQIVADGKALQAEKVELLEEKSRLSGLLEVRDDVREIESYATNTIGMVKSDLVETRHISIAGGERVEVIRANGGEEQGGLFSTVLSAVSTNWERLMDYLD